MSPNNTPILHVGLDVAKLTLELHLGAKTYALTNDRKGHAQLAKRLRARPGAHVVCEATGGYEQPVVRALHAAGLPVSVVEAARVRYFARAQGQRAKTDPIDAALLTAYGDTFKPAVTPPPTATQQRLADLGHLPPQTAAALAGVAPYNRDSGGMKGGRHISGGRRAVRCALYMATLSAIRHDHILKEIYLRLRTNGKKPLVAMTAVMRKLIILMNRLLKY